MALYDRTNVARYLRYAAQGPDRTRSSGQFGLLSKIATFLFLGNARVLVIKNYVTNAYNFM